MFKYLLFDLDGTILDTNETILRTFEETLKLHLNYDVPREELISIFGEPLLKQMTYFSPELAPKMCETYRELYEKHSSVFTTPFPGVKEVLAELKAYQIPMAVVTNKYRQPALQALRDFDLWQYFELLLAGDEVTKGKPDGEPIIKAIKMLEADPVLTLMIGDSPLDIEAAHKGGIKSALVEWNIFPAERFSQIIPDFYLTQMWDIVQLVQNNVA